MKSQWFEYKGKVIELRKQGLSYGEIEKLVGVPRSTLSHWLRDIELSDEQKIRLNLNYGNGLIKARVKSAEVRKTQKLERIMQADQEARSVLDKVSIDEPLLELALAMLYMGEGSKGSTTSIGNSNSLILKFFIKLLLDIYKIDQAKIRCDLHLRTDQDAEQIKKYWSEELNLPLSNFRSVIFDLRTNGRTTYPDYKGVCLVNCGNIAIQRKLISLYNQFCRKVLDEGA